MALTPSQRLLQHFRFDHLPGELQDFSQPCFELAHLMEGRLGDSAEKTAGLRKLLEAKDCFVRAALEQGEYE